MQRFLSLGAECVNIQEIANASQGISIVLVTPVFYFYVLVPIFLMASDVSLFFFCITVALTTARDHISALEAELKASVEAWESANAAKVSAEKAAKSAETRA
jgi:hypothetical protein